MSGRADIFKPATKPYWVSQRERAQTRDALIGVARDLVERHGEPALTLGAVADEAGMARATVYGFFSGRGELLRALQPAVPALWPQEITDEANNPVEESDPAAAIWTNCQPDLSEFLPEGSFPDEEGAQEALLPLAADNAAAVPDPEPTRQDAGAEADTSDDWVVYEAAPAPAPKAEAVEPVEDTPSIEEPKDAVEGDAAPAAEEPQPAETALAEAPAQAPLAPAEPEAEQPELAVETPQETQPEHPEGNLDILAEQGERRRVQAAHLEEIAKRLILPESAIKDGTDAVIARLDTRIRVLEKSITGLETRQTNAEAEGGRRLKPVTDQVEQLQARADGADAKQLKTVSELRLSIHQLETRLDALDAPQRGGAVSGALSWAEPAPQSEPQSETQASDMPAEAEDDDETQTDNPKHAYLSAVRSLAKEGARQAAERETMVEEERQSRRRRMIAAAGVAVLCLGALGALFIFHPGSHGISVAQSRTNPVPPHTAKSAVVAPLDRLSALAQKGEAPAELLIGLKYLEPGGNDALAARWLGRASDHGNAVAQNALGALCQAGRGTGRDLAKATRLYESAAAQGNRHAMSNLAVLYAGADDRMKDFTEAARWFQRSASLGYVDAQFNLAVLYERGDGVPQSLLDAYKWYTIAAASGDAVAKTRADAIATQISPDELAAAQKAVVDFKPQPLNKQANDVPSMPEVLAAK